MPDMFGAWHLTAAVPPKMPAPGTPGACVVFAVVECSTSPSGRTATFAETDLLRPRGRDLGRRASTIRGPAVSGEASLDHSISMTIRTVSPGVLTLLVVCNFGCSPKIAVVGRPPADGAPAGSEVDALAGVDANFGFQVPDGASSAGPDAPTSGAFLGNTPATSWRRPPRR